MEVKVGICEFMKDEVVCDFLSYFIRVKIVNLDDFRFFFVLCIIEVMFGLFNLYYVVWGKLIFMLV